MLSLSRLPPFLLPGLVLPLVQLLPGPEGLGIHEDTLDSLRMLLNDRWILTILLVDLVALAAYNLTGMQVTGKGREGPTRRSRAAAGWMHASEPSQQAVHLAFLCACMSSPVHSSCLPGPFRSPPPHPPVFDVYPRLLQGTSGRSPGP